jgi:putative peptidoglycan lipid II flippase
LKQNPKEGFAFKSLVMKTQNAYWSYYMSVSLKKSVGMATLIMMASVFLSRIMGLVREMVIAYAGGAKGEVDAYQIAFIIPDILNHIGASGFLSVTFIPIFSRYLAEDSEDEGWRVFSNIMTSFSMLLVCLLLIGEWLTPELISLFAPGLKDPQLKASAIRMTRIILPAQLFFFVGGLFMAVQYAKGKFLIPALGPLFYNLGIILGGIFLSPKLGMAGFSWGVLAGALVGNLIIQAWGAKRQGMVFKVYVSVGHPDFRKYILLTLPLIIGLSMTFSTEIFFKFFGSFLPEGSIASLNYGLRVTLMLVAFFGQAAGVASFPFMARLASEGKLSEMNHLLNSTLRYLALVIPFSALLMVLRHETVFILFQRGKFDPEATRMTADALAYLLIGASGFAAQTIVARGYYAIQNTLFPALYGTVAVILSLPLYWLGMNLLGAKGVALAVSFSVMFQSAFLFIVWNVKQQNREGFGVLIFYLKVALVSIPIGLILYFLNRFGLQGLDPGHIFGAFARCAICGIAFLGLLTAAGIAMKIPEVMALFKKTYRKMI